MTPSRVRPLEREPTPSTKPLLTLVADAYDPWAYGYAPTVRAFLREIGDDADSDLLVHARPGQIRPRRLLVPAMRVQAATGARFGPAVAKLALERKNTLDGYAGARALVALRETAPARPGDVLFEATRALFWFGQPLADPTSLRLVCGRLGIDPADVTLLMDTDTVTKLVADDRATATDLGLRRGPLLVYTHARMAALLPGPGASVPLLLKRFGELQGQQHAENPHPPEL